MKLIIVETEEALDMEAALFVSRQVLQKPDSLIGLATGNTTLNLYKQMVRLHRELKIDYSRLKTCNLDEYVGIGENDRRSCHFRIKESLLNLVNIKKENTYVPDGLREPVEKELNTFRETVERFGGIDLQILSVGGNGHIAFNEPGTSFDSTYRLAPISDSTKKAKAELFGGINKVPQFGISMGICDIMMARSILVLAKGKDKAGVIRRIVKGPAAEDVPASVVRLHPDLVIFADQDAASLLSDPH